MVHVILNSGGMDSFFVAHEVPEAVHVFVDIEQKYAAKEYASAQAIANVHNNSLRVVSGPNLGQYEHSTGIIPFRNAQLILCAALHGEDIHMGILANEVNSDKSFEFLRSMETMLTISCRPQYWSEGRTFRIHTPLGTRTKTQLVKDYLKKPGATMDRLLATVSCYSETDTHCGQCPSCFKRWVALTGATGQDYSWHFDNLPHRLPLTHWASRGYTNDRIAEITAAYKVVGKT